MTAGFESVDSLEVKHPQENKGPGA
jgi:hypothetical protein